VELEVGAGSGSNSLEQQLEGGLVVAAVEVEKKRWK